MGVPYVTMNDLSGMIPLPFLIEGLDDDNDGNADPAVWTQVAADVAATIDGKLGVRVPVPFQNPIPASIIRIAKVLAASAIYKRRGKTDANGKLINPFSANETDALNDLNQMATGDLPVSPVVNRQQPSVTPIAARAATASTTGAAI